jgi:hypothetical protein
MKEQKCSFYFFEVIRTNVCFCNDDCVKCKIREIRGETFEQEHTIRTETVH